ncbi:hypothetical protein GJ496_005967 [Pomphorhynchus laevis]|nr:hypothetical protein GJ496_005967 [Pomphorhynchus laevis]
MLYPHQQYIMPTISVLAKRLVLSSDDSKSTTIKLQKKAGRWANRQGRNDIFIASTLNGHEASGIDSLTTRFAAARGHPPGRTIN